MNKIKNGQNQNKFDNKPTIDRKNFKLIGRGRIKNFKLSKNQTCIYAYEKSEKTN
jgi:hypothetical protein